MKNNKFVRLPALIHGLRYIPFRHITQHTHARTTLMKTKKVFLFVMRKCNHRSALCMQSGNNVSSLSSVRIKEYFPVSIFRSLSPVTTNVGVTSNKRNNDI